MQRVFRMYERVNNHINTTSSERINISIPRKANKIMKPLLGSEENDKETLNLTSTNENNNKMSENDENENTNDDNNNKELIGNLLMAEKSY